MKNVANKPINAFDESLSTQMDFLIRSISAAKATLEKRIKHDFLISFLYPGFTEALRHIDAFSARASANPIDIGRLHSKLSDATDALSDIKENSGWRYN
ncbi:MAG: hypothetical protein LBQ23_04050 [Puniceicoccales bacterium]|jgi:hypothetical protein|nr:hypothetical protein [Puniceicoccales bacterium]